MIISHIIGGLGNQMFQYALGRHLSIKNKSELFLDTRDYAWYKLRTFDLGHFPLKAQLASQAQIDSLKSLPILKKLRLPKRSHIIERGMSFDPGILSLGDNIYLDGYWASEKYFEGISEKIREELTLKSLLSTQAIVDLEDIYTYKDSVCVHVRRGDYVSDPKTKAIHTTHAGEYYSAAVERLIEELSDPHFFVFSDDPISPCKLFNFCPVGEDQVYTLTGSARKNYEDLYLMSQCKHHIIANSSFSWWGAWLGETPGQRVIAPKKWYNVGYDTSTLMPERWTKI